MNYSDQTKLTNEDLVAIYPRRIDQGKTYELWQFPYVKDDVLYDEDDIIGLNFDQETTRVSIITEFSHHLQDLDYINRVISLIHDVSNQFTLNKYFIGKGSTMSLEQILEEIKG